MKVIGAGLPRTATLTQKIALDMLGAGPCYHMANILTDMSLVPQWVDALNGQPDWNKIFDGFEAVVDYPGSYFYRELMDVYPEAKVLLSVREPQAWERSMRETVWAVRHGESLVRLLSSAQAHVNEQWRGFLEMIDRLVWEGEGTFAAGHAQPQQLIDTMIRHNREVEEVVPSERLLVWDVKEGWERLCEFLEARVPPQPFPHVNDRTEFLNRVIDGSLQALRQWRSEQASVEPSFAVGG